MYANKTKEDGPFTIYVNQENVLFTSSLFSSKIDIDHIVFKAI